jgi:CBS domain-containing protein
LFGWHNVLRNEGFFIHSSNRLPRRNSAMTTAIEKPGTTGLMDLTAADLMTEHVMTIPQETSLQEAARLLSGSHISGAPVVDSDGACVGVLSSSDFVIWAGQEGRVSEEKQKGTWFVAPWGEMVLIEESANHEVRRYMTARPLTVLPSTRIGELAEKMVEAHIHRLIVVADETRPLGIVTSTDLLAALARAARR